VDAWNGNQLFSSKKNEWGTPWALFEEVNQEFNFCLDAAASKENAKCSEYFTKETDGLTQNWADKTDKGAIWLNPPYGREIGLWVEKAHTESLRGCCVVVLTFVRSDTKWWNEYAMKAAEIRLIPGRVSFGGSKNSAPAPSCLLIFDESRRLPHFSVQNLPRK
jgi:site-specific DNA-methyltransferase (adenine-specific)